MYGEIYLFKIELNNKFHYKKKKNMFKLKRYKSKFQVK